MRMSSLPVLVTVTAVMTRVRGLLPEAVESLAGACPLHCPSHINPVCGSDNRW